MDLDKDPLPIHFIENWIRTKKKKGVRQERERFKWVKGHL